MGPSRRRCRGSAEKTREIAMRFGMIVLVAALVGLLSSDGMCLEDKAADPKPNAGALITELMRVHLDGQKTDMAIWLPFEGFVAIAESQGGDHAAAERDVAILKRYQILMVTRLVDDGTGNKNFATEEQLRDSVVLRGADDLEVKALATVPPQVSAMAAGMRQAMAAQGGENGANMRLLFFPAAVKGKTLVDVPNKGKLTLVCKPIGDFDAYTCDWRTPLDALHGMDTCPHCHELVSGKWSFCPWCGQSLEKDVKHDKAKN